MNTTPDFDGGRGAEKRTALPTEQGLELPPCKAGNDHRRKPLPKKGYEHLMHPALTQNPAAACIKYLYGKSPDPNL